MARSLGDLKRCASERLQQDAYTRTMRGDESLVEKADKSSMVRIYEMEAVQGRQNDKRNSDYRIQQLEHFSIHPYTFRSPLQGTHSHRNKITSTQVGWGNSCKLGAESKLFSTCTEPWRKKSSSVAFIMTFRTSSWNFKWKQLKVYHFRSRFEGYAVTRHTQRLLDPTLVQFTTTRRRLDTWESLSAWLDCVYRYNAALRQTTIAV